MARSTTEGVTDPTSEALDQGDAGALFWRAALTIYGAPGAQAACLELQDDHGLDVPLVLFCAWAGVGGRLDDRRLARAEALSAAWRAAAVAPIRAVRRGLKTAAFDGLAPERVEAFRAEVKALELAAERLQITALGAIAEGLAAEPARLGADEAFSMTLDARRSVDAAPRSAAQHRFALIKRAAENVEKGDALP